MTNAPTVHPITPDGRYFIVHGRLWRMSDPALAEHLRVEFVSALMVARRAVRSARETSEHAPERKARQDVKAAKHSLGERGPVWWNDGSPDYNRHMARNTPYAEWFAGLE